MLASRTFRKLQRVRCDSFGYRQQIESLENDDEAQERQKFEAELPKVKKRQHAKLTRKRKRQMERAVRKVKKHRMK